MNHCKNLEDIVNAVNDVFDQEDPKELEKLFNSTEQEFIARCTPYIGRRIRNETLMWDENSVVHKYFKEKFNVEHADDMSGIVLHCVYRDRNGLKRECKKLAEGYRQFWSRIKYGGNDGFNNG